MLEAEVGRGGPATSWGPPSIMQPVFGPENLLVQGHFIGGRTTGHPLAQQHSESRPDNRAITLPYCKGNQGRLL